MKNLIREAEAIVEANARHRKGWRAQEITYEHVFNFLHGEVVELFNAISKNDPVAEQKDEMGDVLAVISHIIVRQGWDFDEVEKCGVAKLRNRWSGYTPPASPSPSETEYCPNEFCQHQRKEMTRLYARVDFLEARYAEAQAFATRQADRIRELEGPAAALVKT